MKMEYLLGVDGGGTRTTCVAALPDGQVVRRAVGLLKKGEYILVDKEGFITLTEKGLSVAEKIYERHTVLSQMLIALGVSQQVAAEDAAGGVLLQNNAVSIDEDLYLVADINAQIFTHALGQNNAAQLIDTFQNPRRFHVHISLFVSFAIWASRKFIALLYQGMRFLSRGELAVFGFF